MIDFDALNAQLVRLLNAPSAAELVWWTSAELAVYLTEAARRISTTGTFVEQVDTFVSADGASYSVPPDMLSLIAVSLDGSALRAANVREMEAASDTWTEDAGTPDRWLLDVAGLGTITLWKKPEADGTATLVYHAHINGQGTHRFPAALGMAMKYSALAAARAKAGEGQAPDIAEAAAERARVIEAAAAQYWEGAL